MFLILALPPPQKKNSAPQFDAILAFYTSINNSMHQADTCEFYKINLKQGEGSYDSGQITQGRW